MKIGLTWDQSSLEAFVGELPKRLTYATVNAVRETALGIQQAEFEQARREFTIRKDQFFFGSATRPGGVAARITTMPSASSGKGIANGTVFAEIEVGTVSGNPLDQGFGRVARQLLYPQFEAGGTRYPFTPGAKNVAVPVTGGARPSRTSAIDPQFTFAKMQLRAFLVGRKLTRQTRSRKNLPVGMIGEFGRTLIPRNTAGINWKGKNRTFIAFTQKHPLGEVLQRTGPKTVRPIWSFVPPFPIDHRLHFVELAQSVADRIFAAACARQVEDMLSHDVIKALRSA